MSLRVIRDRVLVRRDEPIKEVNGIIVPEGAQKFSHWGTVVSVGSGKLDERGNIIPPSVKAGDRVCFQRHSGSDVEHDGEQFLIIKGDDILAAEGGE